MKSYVEFQKEVFDWLKEKNSKDPSFTFSLRRVASKGSETNYFIGTEKSKYFGTTFWTIPVNFPGSASDLINLMFKITDNGYLYYLQFNQTRSPNGTQNDYALDFIRNLKNVLKRKYAINENAPENKMEYYNIPPRKGSYDSVKDLLNDVGQDIEEWLGIIDTELIKYKDKYKSKFPEFNAHRITKDEFEIFISKLNKRLAKHSIVSIDIAANKEPVVESEIKKVEESFPKRELNQILYGPPGTGKTYNTINNAISIIENSSENELLLKYPNRAFLKRRFLDLNIDDFSQDEGQIAFVTFHQSMSYEDFIEGIKPIVVGEKNERKVVYDTLPGIFKQICTLAKENWLASQRIVKNTSTFDEVFEIFKDEVEESDEVSIPMKTEGKNYTVYGFTKSSINFRKASGSSSHTLSISTLRDYYYGIKEIRPHGLGIYYPSLIEKLRSYKPIVNIGQNTMKNYVLIIDEINRGNVSQIFGELITLIEEDKRLGKEEALEVTLPYSKEKFGVPPNLYIVGTMNTADRSVEALDAALRRRFSFVEMAPKPELIKTKGKAQDGIIEGIDLVNLLTTINKRIEVLLDKNHQIGHSYFMGVSNIDELKLAFQNKIIPLLQEYFFGDYGKIGLVLGGGFVYSEPNDTNVFAKFDTYDASDFTERVIYKIENVATMEDQVFHAAVITLLNN